MNANEITRLPKLQEAALCGWLDDLSMTQTGRLRLEHRHGWLDAGMD